MVAGSRSCASHEGSVSSLAASPTIPGLLASASADEPLLKIWNAKAQPLAIARKDAKMVSFQR